MPRGSRHGGGVGPTVCQDRRSEDEDRDDPEVDLAPDPRGVHGLHPLDDEREDGDETKDKDGPAEEGAEAHRERSGLGQRKRDGDKGDKLSGKTDKEERVLPHGATRSTGGAGGHGLGDPGDETCRGGDES